MLFVIMGRSGSGKTTITEALSEKYGYRSVWSYTTRPRRSADERGHIFISDEEYEGLQDKVAEVCYKGHQYCSTKQQLMNSDIYVAEPSAINELQKANIPFVVVCLKVSEETAIERMRNRGSSEQLIIDRTAIDRFVFNEEDSIMNPEIGYKLLGENITYISAEMPLEKLIKKVKEIIENE